MAVPGESLFSAGLSLVLDDRLSSELGEAAAKTEAAGESIESTAEDMDDAGRSADNLAGAARRSDESMDTATAGASALGSQVADTEERLSSAARTTENFSTRMNNAADRFERTGQRLTEAGQSLAMAGGATLAPIAGAVTQAGRFEQAMIEVQKVTDETTAAGLSSQIEELSTRIPRASTELAGLAADAARFGVQGEENILAFTESTAKMATATDLSTDEAGTAFAKLSTLTGTPIPKVENLGSSINALSNNMATSSGEIVDSMLRSSQALEQLGLSATQMPAISAVLNEVSESSERAGTRLRRFGQELLDPDKASKMAGAIGLSVEQFTRMRDESPVQLMSRMAERFNEGGKQAGRLRSVLSSTSQQTVSALAANIDELNGALGLSETAFERNVSLQREFDAATQTLFNQITLLWNRTKRLARLVGAELLPTIKSGVSTLQGFLEPVNEWIQANPKLTKQLAFVTVGVGGLLTVVGGGLALLGLFAQGIGAGAAALGSMASFLAPGGALLSGLGGMASTLAAIATGIGGLIGGGLLAGLGTLAAVGALIFKFWRPLAAFFSGLFEGLFSAVRPLAGTFTRFWSALQPVRNLFVSLLTPVGDSVSEFESFATAGRFVGSVIGTVVTGGLKALIGSITTALEFWTEFLDGILRFGQLLSEGKPLEAGKALIDGFVRGIKSAASSLWSTMKDIAGGVREYLPFSPAKRGPLSDLDETGPAMMSTITEGLDGSPLRQRMDAIMGGVGGRAVTMGLRADATIPSVPSLQEGRTGVGRGGPAQPAPQGRRPVTINVEHNNEINVGSDADPDQVQRAVEEGNDDFERRLRRVLEEEDRTSF